MRKTAAIAVVVLFVAAGASVTACGSNTCDDADARYQECGLTTPDQNVDCSGETECYAACIVNADCDTLTNMKVNPAFTKCKADCASH